MAPTDAGRALEAQVAHVPQEIVRATGLALPKIKDLQRTLRDLTRRMLEATPQK
ncbi:hypothetical protein [Roseobacter cerasinus]|uniref:hypothetical protein n=1 Tax=Roseobacter cerasinus TaxID=2602289 RepID=UPI00135937C5|nr:hypothetical protein [Roseobacter cerasinus]